LTVVNTNLPIILWFQRNFGGSVNIKRASCSRHRDAFHWVVCGTNARLVLEELMPFLREKRRQAALAMRIADMPPNRREPFIRKLAEMKVSRHTL
jgi:hypothetical protein